MNIEHEKTKEILKWFEEISKIPRCSKNEDKICEWLVNWAKENNFESKVDETKNLIIKVPASPGKENSPTVTIQGHMDMVCEKTKDSKHDFTKDPIKLVYDGEWLTADQTTLGSDNGIAIAMGMTLALDKEVEHGPLELLFTVDEETGLTGANALEPGFVEGKILLNIDSEDEGVFTVGCAGGMNTYLSLQLEYENVPSGNKKFQIEAGGMKGGHSGIDINAEKANAIRVLGRILYQIKEEIDIRLADIKGGSAHNAIPRDADASVFIAEKDVDKFKKITSDFEKTVKNEFQTTEPDLYISSKIADDQRTECMNSETTKKVIDFITVIPHGVDSMSADIKDLVETSNNFASVKIEKGELKILTSQRSSLVSKLNSLTKRIETISNLSGGKAQSGDGYPPWPPNMDSSLLKKSEEIYEKMYNKKPVVEVIHAGLECGIIGDKYPGMDMISFGPTLKYPHSPDEKIHIGTIGKVWDFMIELIKNLM